MPLDDMDLRAIGEAALKATTETVNAADYVEVEGCCLHTEVDGEEMRVDRFAQQGKAFNRERADALVRELEVAGFEIVRRR